MFITNFDLIIGRWSLQMDEKILFEGLKKMFRQDSKEQLFRFIYHGHWPNYRTIFFNLNAILCLLTKIFDSFLPIPNKTDKFYTNRFFETFENGMLDMMQLFLAR